MASRNTSQSVDGHDSPDKREPSSDGAALPANDPTTTAPLAAAEIAAAAEPLLRDARAPREEDARVAADRDAAEELRKRRMFDEIRAEHHVNDWAGLEHTGTIAVVVGVEALLHIGRGEYVRLDIARDLRGVAPTAGAFVSLDKHGTITDAQRPHDRTVQHERERGR